MVVGFLDCLVKLYFGLKSYKHAKKKAKRHNSCNKTKRTQSHIKKNVLQLWVKNSWQKYLGFYMIQHANAKFYD